MLLRNALGDTLRNARTGQNRTLRDVSAAANVSLGYLSEVERGRKEASSELLASICDALDLQLSDVLDTVSRSLRDDAMVGNKAAMVGGKVAVVGNSFKGGLTASNRPAFDPSLRIVLPYRMPRPNPTPA